MDSKIKGVCKSQESNGPDNNGVGSHTGPVSGSVTYPDWQVLWGCLWYLPTCFNGVEGRGPTLLGLASET